MIYLNTLLAEAKLKLNIPSDIKKLYKLFKKNGKQLYVVGGGLSACIRVNPFEMFYVSFDDFLTLPLYEKI